MNSGAVFEALAKIKAGDTLCSDLTIVEHGTWFSFLKRSLSGDTRYLTLQIIEDAVQDYCQNKKDAKYLKTKEIVSLEETRIGIKNLMETYSHDKDILSRLKSCHLKLRTLITSKPERSFSSSSEEEKEHQRNLFTSGEEFEIEEEEEEKEEEEEEEEKEEEEEEEEEERRKEIEKSPFQPIEMYNPNVCKPEMSKSPPENPSIDYVPGAKFEKYLKKKKDGGELNRGRDYKGRSLSRNMDAIRKLPKLHVITMGDVFSKIDLLPPSLSNPLLSSLSQISETRDVTWYVENFLKK